MTFSSSGCSQESLKLRCSSVGGVRLAGITSTRRTCFSPADSDLLNN